MSSAVSIYRVSKTFSRDRQALKSVSLDVEQGEMVALIGASGSGKSTLLRHIAGLVECDKNDCAKISISGRSIQCNGTISANARSIRSSVGVVFQQFNLVGRLKVLTNVLLGNLGNMPRWKGSLGLFSDDQKKAAMRALERVGISPQAMQRGSTLSGGEQQRAAIARTLVQGSKLLIADEPIASLDPSSARKVMEILKSLNTKDKITVMVSLHQVEYALNYCRRTIALRKGEVVYDGPSSALTPEFLNQLYGAESETFFVPQIAQTTEANTSNDQLANAGIAATTPIPAKSDAGNETPQPLLS